MNAASVPSTNIVYSVVPPFEKNPYDPALIERVRKDVANVFAPKYLVTAAGVGGDGKVIFHLKDSMGILRAKVFAEPEGASAPQAESVEA